MFHNFHEVEEYIKKENIRKKLVLVCAQDEAALSAVVHARRQGVVEGILLGKEEEIKEILIGMGEAAEDYNIINESGERECSEMAVAMVRDGRADIEMKGLLASSEYLIPIMNPFDGLLPLGGAMSEATVFLYPAQNRLMIATDCAMTIAPDLDKKVQLIENAVKLAKAFGIEKVNVAVISALETVNPEMPSTVEAQQLAEMSWPEGVNVVGPFPLDIALDREIALHKGLDNPAAGNADVLLFPDICSGNVFHKAIHYFAHVPSAGVVCGTDKPVVFTSRSDSAETKYNSILSAIMQSL